jgi:Ca2+-binding EF-hand superfamily protein
MSVTAHEHAYMHLSGRQAAATCSTPFSLARLSKKLKAGKLRVERKDTAPAPRAAAGVKNTSPRAKDEDLVRPGLPVPIVPQLSDGSKEKKPVGKARAAPAGGTSPKEKFVPKARPVGASPAAGSAPSAKAGKGGARFRLSERKDSESGADLKDLERIFTSPESATLTVADLPTSPSHYLEKAGPSPVLLTLCKLWVGTPLSDQRWSQALQIFEQELGDQGLGAKRAPKVGGWTLETFSMWLLKKGRRLRECSQWFKAFDANQDKVISVVDFLQGIVACLATTANAQSQAGMARAQALFRLFDSENRGVLSAKDVEAFVQECCKETNNPGKVQELCAAFPGADSTQFVRLLQKVDSGSILQLEPF